MKIRSNGMPLEVKWNGFDGADAEECRASVGRCLAWAGACYALAWAWATVKWGGVGYLAGCAGLGVVAWVAAKLGEMEVAE